MADSPIDSAAAYETHAREFLRNRDSSPIGSQVVDSWARSLSSGASVIELGCGGGYPITRILDQAGLRLWTVDSSPTLAAEFHARFPHIAIECARVQESSFFEQQYDGAIAVGLVFLLPESEQSALISNIARILVPGGRFLFTAPIETGSWIDSNTGLTCWSPGQKVYEEYLISSGFRKITTFADAGANNYYDVVRVL